MGLIHDKTHFNRDDKSAHVTCGFKRGKKVLLQNDANNVWHNNYIRTLKEYIHNLSLQYVKTVSYTHLDVYKRQFHIFYWYASIEIIGLC